MSTVTRPKRRAVHKPMIAPVIRIRARLALGHTPCGNFGAHGRHNFDTLWTRSGFVVLDPGAYRGRHRKPAKRA
jgi:hypothetical protein